MKEILENWVSMTVIIAFIGGVIVKVTKYFYKKLILDPLADHQKQINEQSKNYNLKFDETHTMIKEVKEDVSAVKNDTSKIMGSLDVLLRRGQP